MALICSYFRLNTLKPLCRFVSVPVLCSWSCTVPSGDGTFSGRNASHCFDPLQRIYEHCDGAAVCGLFKQDINLWQKEQ